MIAKTFPVLLVAILSLAPPASVVFAQGPVSSTQSYSGQVALEAKQVSADFTPDANLGKKVWQKAQWSQFEKSISGKDEYAENRTRVAAAWSDKYVYFAFICNYDVLNVFEGEDISRERWELWTRDVAEVFLNPQPERLLHYYEFEIAPNNQWVDLEITRGEKPNHDASWNSGFEHAVKVDVKHRVWNAEMRIPLSSMNVARSKPGMEWRVNFFRAAGKGSDAERKFLAWSTIPEGTTFHVPSRFGILRLVN
jgi:Carbohydrate family 9 binding domain-like